MAYVTRVGDQQHQYIHYARFDANLSLRCLNATTGRFDVLVAKKKAAIGILFYH